jgi:hypothetical protein
MSRAGIASMSPTKQLYFPGIRAEIYDATAQNHGVQT